MNVLLINGSPHKHGSTDKALRIVKKSLNEEGIETTVFWIGAKPVQGCVACMACKKDESLKRCVMDDEVSHCTDLMLEADGIIIGSPVYFGGPSGSLCAFLDRAFYPVNRKLAHKLGASVTALRRSGGTATLNRMNLYFTNTQMHVVSSNYWPIIHGMVPQEIECDLEGVEVLRSLGKNMAWLLKCIEKSGLRPPQQPIFTRTDFVRDDLVGLQKDKKE